MNNLRQPCLKLEDDRMDLNQPWKRIGEKRLWKLKVENDLVLDILYEYIAALDEDLENLEEIRSYQKAN